MLGQGKDLESFGDGGLHPVAQIGCALAVFFDECFEFGFCVLKSVGIEDRAYVGTDGFAHVELGHVGLCVLLEMELASLPRRGIEDGSESGADALVRVGSN